MRNSWQEFSDIIWKGRENDMATEAKKGLTVQIPLDLHTEVKQYIEQNNMTMAEFVALALQDELHPQYQEKEENKMANMRTLAFQVPEDLFQKIKDYLRRNNVTQKEFVMSLIENEIERDLAAREEQNKEPQNEETEEEPFEDTRLGEDPEETVEEDTEETFEEENVENEDLTSDEEVIEEEAEETVEDIEDLDSDGEVVESEKLTETEEDFSAEDEEAEEIENLDSDDEITEEEAEEEAEVEDLEEAEYEDESEDFDEDAEYSEDEDEDEEEGFGMSMGM